MKAITTRTRQDYTGTRSSWNEQKYGGLEVDPVERSYPAVEARPEDGLHIDYNKMPIEQDPYALPSLYVRPSSRDGKILNETGPSDPDKPHTICGLRRRLFWILVGIGGFIIIGGAVGGWMGSHYARRKASTLDEEKSSPILQNSSIAAVQWRDESLNNSHYRVYIQSNKGRILEAAWNSEDPSWTVSAVTAEDADVMSGTPLAASAGYLFVNDTADITKKIQFIGRTGTIYELQSPFNSQPDSWGNTADFTRINAASNGTSLVSFWYQEMNQKDGSLSTNTSQQTRATLYQDIGPNSVTIRCFSTERTGDWGWYEERTSLSIQDGSSLAIAPVKTSDRQFVRLYVGDAGGHISQAQYDVWWYKIENSSQTPFEITPHTPLSVSTQDNTNYFTNATLPECVAKGEQLTHLILYASPDRSSLLLGSWNCSSGFTDQTYTIQALLKPERTYLGLANTVTSIDSEDQRVYVLLDGVDGPEIEEWQVPLGSQHADWKVLASIPVSINSEA